MKLHELNSPAGGDPSRIRTCNPRSRNPLLYPVELWDRNEFNSLGGDPDLVFFVSQNFFWAFGGQIPELAQTRYSAREEAGGCAIVVATRLRSGAFCTCDRKLK